MRYIGIDPGKSTSYPGGVAWIEDNRYGVYDLPIEISDISKVISGTIVGDCVAAVEQEWAWSGSPNGSEAYFKLGQSYGEIQMCLHMLGVKVILVPSQTWQKAMLDPGLKGREAKKANALDKARLLFPHADLRYKKYSGRADSLLIARWIQQQ